MDWLTALLGASGNQSGVMGSPAVGAAPAIPAAPLQGPALPIDLFGAGGPTMGTPGASGAPSGVPGKADGTAGAGPNLGAIAPVLSAALKTQPDTMPAPAAPGLHANAAPSGPLLNPNIRLPGIDLRSRLTALLGQGG